MNRTNWYPFNRYFSGLTRPQIAQVKGLLELEHKWQILERRIDNNELQVQSLERTFRFWRLSNAPSKNNITLAIDTLTKRLLKAQRSMFLYSRRLMNDANARAHHMESKGINLTEIQRIANPGGTYWRHNELPVYRPPPTITRYNYQRFLDPVPRRRTFRSMLRNQRSWSDRIRNAAPPGPPPRPDTVQSAPEPIPVVAPAVAAAPVQPEQPPLPIIPEERVETRMDVDPPVAADTPVVVPYAGYPPLAPGATMSSWLGPRRTAQLQNGDYDPGYVPP